VMLFFDPISGKRKTKSAGTTDPREAERRAALWQAELNSGGGHSPSKITWAEFRKRYEAEHLATLAEKTIGAAMSSLNHLERVLNADRLCKLTSTTISRFQVKLREEGMKDSSLAHHLRHIKAALSWGVKMGLLAKRPDFVMPKKAKGQTMMRGRPITTEEFERMIAACDKARPQDADAWKQFITGLWLSGLRLEESLSLSWDADAPFAIDLSGRRPAFRIYAEAHKARRDTVLPMTPDFAEWLQTTFSEGERQGRVFKLNGLQTGSPITPKRVIKIVSNIGKKAGVVVNKTDGKFASAHDLRRAFGTRWAPRVKPATLQLLMRHAEIGTTMKYYVAQDAADVADELWANFGTKAEVYNIPYNIGPEMNQEAEKTPTDESAEVLTRQTLI
ncbi:MAG: site-specific integrase, partial [Pirellulales bacterium]|nr:site-specific integrase [Pirellulales bacterium]